MNKKEVIVWQSLSWPSTIVHTHTVDKDIEDHGLAVGKTDRQIPFAIQYHLTMTLDWRIKELSIGSLLDERKIGLVHHGDRWYDVQDHHLPEFDGVELVDISISPFTNTLPIKQLHFEGENSQEVDVIYFDENQFSLRRVQQLYSQIDDLNYYYQDIELPEFASNILVDEDGLVVDFRKLFRRV